MTVLLLSLLLTTTLAATNSAPYAKYVSSASVQVKPALMQTLVTPFTFTPLYPSPWERLDWSLQFIWTDTTLTNNPNSAHELTFRFDVSAVPSYKFRGIDPLESTWTCSFTDLSTFTSFSFSPDSTNKIFSNVEKRPARFNRLDCLGGILAPWQIPFFLEARQLVGTDANSLTSAIDTTDPNPKLFFSGYTPHPHTGKLAPILKFGNWGGWYDARYASFTITELDYLDINKIAFILCSPVSILTSTVLSYEGSSTVAPVSTLSTAGASPYEYMDVTPTNYKYQFITFDSVPIVSKSISSIFLNLTWNSIAYPSEVDITLTTPMYLGMFAREHIYLDSTALKHRMNPIRVGKAIWQSLSASPSISLPLYQQIRHKLKNAVDVATSAIPLADPEVTKISSSLGYIFLAPSTTTSFLPKLRDAAKILALPVKFTLSSSVHNSAYNFGDSFVPFIINGWSGSDHLSTIEQYYYISPFLYFVPYEQRKSLFSLQDTRTSFLLEMPPQTQDHLENTIQFYCGPYFFGTKTFTWNSQTVTGSLARASLRIPGYVPDDTILTIKIPVGSYIKPISSTPFTFNVAVDYANPELGVKSSGVVGVELKLYDLYLTRNIQTGPVSSAEIACPTDTDSTRRCNSYSFLMISTPYGITVGYTLYFDVFRPASGVTTSLFSTFDSTNAKFDDQVTYTESPNLASFIDFSVKVKNLPREQANNSAAWNSKTYYSSSSSLISSDPDRTIQLGTYPVSQPIPFILKQHKVGTYNFLTNRIGGTTYGAYITMSSVVSQNSFFRPPAGKIDRASMPPTYNLNDALPGFYRLIFRSFPANYVAVKTRPATNILAGGEIKALEFSIFYTNAPLIYYISGGSISTDTTNKPDSFVLSVDFQGTPSTLNDGFNSYNLDIEMITGFETTNPPANAPPSVVPLKYTLPYTYYKPSITITFPGSTIIPLVNTMVTPPTNIEVGSLATFNFEIKNTNSVGIIILKVKDSTSNAVLESYVIPKSTELTMTRSFQLTAATVSNQAYIEINVNHPEYETNQFTAIVKTINFRIASTITNVNVSPTPIDAGETLTLTFQSGATGTATITYFSSPTASLSDGNTKAYVIKSNHQLVSGTNTVTVALNKNVFATKTAFIRVQQDVDVYNESPPFTVYTYLWDVNGVITDCDIPGRFCGTFTIPASHYQCLRSDGQDTVEVTDATQATSKCGSTKPKKDYQCTKANCSNDGECLSATNPTAPNTCVCNQPYAGDTCSEVKSGCSYCDSAHSTCVEQSPYTCVCNTGFAGSSCDKQACYDCVSANTEQCDPPTSSRSYGVCKCKEGYIGDSCEKSTIVDPCLSCANDKNNTMQCENSECVCNAGWGGKLCSDLQTNVELCSHCSTSNTNSCGPVSTDSPNGQCFCKLGWTGVSCRTPSSACSECTEANVERCDESGTTPVCICKEGWDSELCTEYNGTIGLSFHSFILVIIIWIFALSLF